jgi:hypothetical protein
MSQIKDGGQPQGSSVFEQEHMHPSHYYPSARNSAASELVMSYPKL